MTRSSSDLVFPRPDGTMHSPELNLDPVLRRALGRAGVVTGYMHECRRHHCGYEVKASTSECGRWLAAKKQGPALTVTSHQSVDVSSADQSEG